MSKPFSTVLIANRGEIAVRVIRACHLNGFRAVAVYSDADAEALHVRLADEAHRLGPPAAGESYLNVSAILEAAGRSGAEAIHPGYGFLAESADFAERCQRAGLIWIGPPPAAMRLLGDKSAAKSLAQQVGVPTLPGYHGKVQDDAILRAEAERIGYPLLIKAALGGGGRGMRLVCSVADLEGALDGARRESLAAFGDDRLLLERYLERPRHVEMQIFGDTQGNVLFLGERDCSIQRRHQKIIEEAPAPHFSEDQRRAMGEAAIALGRAAGYANAGTVEFLLDQDGSFYFLEVNTRLQVEHPVTEMVARHDRSHAREHDRGAFAPTPSADPIRSNSCLDLVSLQFHVAAGEPLPFEQQDVRILGHAVEARLYAEDPASGFLPSSGRLVQLELPVNIPGVRVDTGLVPGDFVSTFYDPLLAKVIVQARNRDAALDLLAQALGAVRIDGVRTNLELLQAIVASPAFGDGRAYTGLVDELGLASGARELPDALLVAAAASAIPALRHTSGLAGNPWHDAGPWRPVWAGSEVHLRYAGSCIRIGLSRPVAPGQPWSFELPGGIVEYRVWPGDGQAILLDGPRGRQVIDVHVQGNRRTVHLGRLWAHLELVSALAADTVHGTAESLGGHDVVRAPMPGRIVKVAVRPGESVKQNQTLLVLEAMKIEHLVCAPRVGVVERVRYKEGDQVELGAELVDLEDLP